MMSRQSPSTTIALFSNTFCLEKPPLQQFRVQDKLLRVLKMVGATEKLYTTKQIISYLGKYIEQRKLYDSSNIRVVHCKDDPLENLFGVQVFTIGDYNDIWRLVCPYLIPATYKEVQENNMEKNRQQPNSSSDEGHQTDFKWMSQLPWWYFVEREVNSGNNHDKATASGSIVAHSTAYVVDTDYESDTNDSKFTNLGHDGEDPFSVEYEPDSESSDATEPIVSDDEPLFPLPPSRFDENDETTTTTTDTTDVCMDFVDIPLEDHWRCTECETVNSPILAYCQRCWKLRKGWLPNSTVSSPGLAKSLTMPTGACQDNLPAFERSSSVPNRIPLGVDVTDGRKMSTETDGASSKGFADSNFDSLPFNNGKRKQDATEPDQEPPQKVRNVNRIQSDNEASTSKKLTVSKVSMLNSDSTVRGNSSNSTDASSKPSLPNYSYAVPGLCNICHNNPNDATIVHGKFGHQFCCYRCAKRLKKSGKTCPVCRQPIAFVVKNYICQM